MWRRSRDRRGDAGCDMGLSPQPLLDLLPGIADFSDRLLDGRGRSSRFPGLVSDLVVLPARHAAAVLLAPADGLFLCLLSHDTPPHGATLE